MSKDILRAENLVKEYPIRGSDHAVRAVDHVAFRLARGETLGIVGESGCGKSTTGRLLIRLEAPTSGRIWLDDTDITAASGRELRAVRRRIQLVFQDPQSSLNPRRMIGDTLDEVLRVHRIGVDTAGRRRRLRELLGMVGLPASYESRYPHEMSGGQRQRVGIARALAVEPEILILDEPVSALDVSMRAGVMNLLAGLRDELGLSYIFISHDLGMVRHISNRIAVMYLGQIVEWGPWAPVSDSPLHPYTTALQQAVPVADPELEARREVTTLRGELPDPANPPPGCNFSLRCPLVEDVCRVSEPGLRELQPAHFVACHVASANADGSIHGLPEDPASPAPGARS